MDPILNSLNYYYKNCIVDSKENYKFDLEVNRFISARQAFLANFFFASFLGGLVERFILCCGLEKINRLNP